jgi:hypothetical protein
LPVFNYESNYGYSLFLLLFHNLTYFCTTSLHAYTPQIVYLPIKLYI